MNKLVNILETSINRLLEYDPDSVERLNAIADKIIMIEFKGVDQSVTVRCRSDSIQLSTEVEACPDLQLSGTPLAFLRLAQQQASDGGGFGDGDIEVQGDVHLAQQLQQLIAGLDIEWEEIASNYTGDIIAHHLGRGARSARQWFRQTQQTAQQNIGEYLCEEARLIAPEHRVQQFNQQVDRLRADVDRLEQRVNRLKTTLT